MKTLASILQLKPYNYLALRENWIPTYLNSADHIQDLLCFVAGFGKSDHYSGLNSKIRIPSREYANTIKIPEHTELLWADYNQKQGWHGLITIDFDKVTEKKLSRTRFDWKSPPPT